MRQELERSRAEAISALREVVSAKQEVAVARSECRVLEAERNAALDAASDARQFDISKEE